LLARTLGNLYAIPTGFDPGHIVTARISPPNFRYGDPVARRQVFESITERISALPDVSAIALTDRLPFSDELYGSVFIIEGRPDPARTGDWPLADVSAIVTPRYFSLLGIPLIEGRDFSRTDTDRSPGVAIVSESLARQYWPGESAVGRRFTFPGDRRGYLTIVGVVGDVKWSRLTDGPTPALFLPLSQASPGAMRAVVRATGSSDVLSHLRAVVGSVDAETPVDQMRPMTALIATSVAQPRFAALLVAAFAALGLLLGAIGIYGTITDHVIERRREIGVRVALGARPLDVLRAVLVPTLLVAAAGLIAGLVAAVVSSRLFAAMLVGVGPTDPATLGLSALVLASTAGLAGYLPARRAATLDPLTVLRAD
jgi:putative ABC transport system permease protein